MENWDPLILQIPCNHLKNVIFIYFIYFFLKLQFGTRSNIIFDLHGLWVQVECN